MCIRIDGQHHAFFHGSRDPGPVEVQSARMCIDLDRHAMLCTGFDDLKMIDRITGTAQEQSTRRMSEDRRTGMFDRPE